MQPNIQNEPSLDYEAQLKRVDSMLKYAMESRVSSVKDAIDLTIQAQAKCVSLNYAQGLAQCSCQLGLFYMIIGDHLAALEYSQDALKLFTELASKQGMADALFNIGSIEYKSTKYHKGLERFYECLRIQREIKDVVGESRTLKAIGFIYEAFNEYDKALETYQKCRELSHLNNDKNGESNACNPLSGIYLKRGDYKNALETINTSIILKKETGDKRGLAFAWYGKGKIHLHLKEYEEARGYFLKSLKVHNEVGDKMGCGMSMTKLGQVCKSTNQYSEAKKYFHEAIALGESLDNLQLMYKAYYELFDIAMNDSNESEALAFHIKYHNYKEQVLNSETKSKIKSLESMWKMESLESEARLQRENNYAIEKKNEELDKFSSRVSHDLRGPISSLMGLYDVVRSEISDENALRYFQLYHHRITRINQTIIDLLELSKVKDWQLSSTRIDFDEMVADCIESFSYLPGFDKIQFDIELDKEMEIESDRSLMNTIIQNLIENSIKYARQDIDNPFVKIQVKQTAEDYMCVIVEDNGIGIEEEYQTKVFDMFYRANDEVQGSGLGMFILKSAVEKLEGEVSLMSEVNKGTKFVVLLPILENLKKEYLGI
ncbi:tetratricopeptide repeat-containing sensor histidine kinase [Reichenbachiella carrageenanivorans]|uniref:histidine kinase n=1 Tax=Reichenbachiella carrageenanivorans TaxID=2979869 RepID=A0ABY6CWD5_9BACT|nr:tetratricopeptide repeat-containing sensor histidine kinase [Reichenbachiella carrageenanivorans]UXX78224.1 tetratricopeptide repeat-containing sensor histidine kinase [Reichenbachiella carrageenanivorans]